jgi:hypothetical protein
MLKEHTQRLQQQQQEDGLLQTIDTTTEVGPTTETRKIVEGTMKIETGTGIIETETKETRETKETNEIIIIHTDIETERTTYPDRDMDTDRTTYAEVDTDRTTYPETKAMKRITETIGNT